MASSLRFHLLIGPPASGRTTVARRLAAWLEARGREALVLSISEHLQKQMESMTSMWLIAPEAARPGSIAALRSGGRDPLDVVIDGTAATRAQRLRNMQIFDPGGPIDWIGWWLHTPLGTCQSWNHRRTSVRWSSEEIVEAFRQFTDRRALPSIEEGFSTLVHLDPSEFTGGGEGSVLDGVLDLILGDLPGCCAEVAAQREGLQLHAYSCLFDFDRLMQDLAKRLQPDSASREIIQMSEQISELSKWRQLLEIVTYTKDLDWIMSNSLLLPLLPDQIQDPIFAPEPKERTQRHRGGWHRYSDARAFETLLEELRLFLHSNLDQPYPPSPELQELIDRYSLRPWGSESLPEATENQP
ncbi:MAG: AAA family ATPase [Verrucomicrobiaceae bacterium]